MNPDTKQIFELFVKKAHELRARNFAKYLNENKLAIQFSWQEDNTIVIENIGPDDDAILAFVPTLRLFIQGEPISLHKMAKFITDADLSEQWKSGFGKLRNSINAFLDETPNLPVPESEQHPTRRDILDILINGDIQHVKDPDKRKMFERWESQGLFFVTLNNEFNLIMLVIFRTVEKMAQLCETELNL